MNRSSTIRKETNIADDSTSSSTSRRRPKRARPTQRQHDQQQTQPQPHFSPAARRRRHHQPQAVATATSSTVFVHEALFIIHCSRGPTRRARHASLTMEITSRTSSVPAGRNGASSANGNGTRPRISDMLPRISLDDDNSDRLLHRHVHVTPRPPSPLPPSSKRVRFTDDAPSVIDPPQYLESPRSSSKGKSKKKRKNSKNGSHHHPQQQDYQEESSSTWYTPTEMNSFKEVVREAGRRAHINQLERLASKSAAVAKASSGAGRLPHRPPSPPPLPRDSSSSSSSDSDREEEQDDDGRFDSTARGLDYRTSLERQRNRLIAIRAVLECQRRLRSGQLPASCGARSSGGGGGGGSGSDVSPEIHLALISAKCTRWSRELAYLIGRHDFYSAYPEFRDEATDVPLPELSSLDHMKPFPKCLKRSVGTGMMATGPRLGPAGRAAGRVAGMATAGPMPTVLVATVAAEEEDSDDEARRRLQNGGRGAKRRRVTSSSAAGGGSSSDGRSAAAVLVGC